MVSVSTDTVIKLVEKLSGAKNVNQVCLLLFLAISGGVLKLSQFSIFFYN